MSVCVCYTVSVLSISTPPCVCRMQRRLHLEQRITPHRVRHILVSFVQQHRAVFGGVEDQMAHLMGHALRQWQVRCSLLVGFVHLPVRACAIVVGQ